MSAELGPSMVAGIVPSAESTAAQSAQPNTAPPTQPKAAPRAEPWWYVLRWRCVWIIHRFADDGTHLNLAMDTHLRQLNNLVMLLMKVATDGWMLPMDPRLSLSMDPMQWLGMEIKWQWWVGWYDILSSYTWSSANTFFDNAHTLFLNNFSVLTLYSLSDLP